MVGSWYLKIKIVDKDMTRVTLLSKSTSRIRHSDTHSLVYLIAMETLLTMIGITLLSKMNYAEVNTQIYGAAGLSAEQFHQFYGKNQGEFTVKASVLLNNGDSRDLFEQKYYNWSGRWDIDGIAWKHGIDRISSDFQQLSISTLPLTSTLRITRCAMLMVTGIRFTRTLTARVLNTL